MRLKNIIFTAFILSLASCNAEDYKSGEVTFNPDQPDEPIVQTKVNFAAGKFYKVNATAHKNFQDQYPITPWSTGSKLTDEEIGGTSPKDYIVSWENQTVEVEIDLGSLRTIEEVAIHAVADQLYSMKLPSQATLAYSRDNQSWTKNPNSTTFTSVEPTEHIWSSIPVNKAECRYVKVVLVPPAGERVAIAIDEIKVMGEYKTDPKYVPKNGCYHGAFCPLYAYDPEDREGITDACAVTLFEKMVGKQLSIMLWYQNMEQGRNFAEMQDAREKYWSKNFNGTSRIFLYGWTPPTKSAPIAQGSLDDFFKAYFTEVTAQSVKDMGPVWFRPMNEMNGGWISYFRDTKNYVRAWRRMYNIAEQLGLTAYNVFVWSPNSVSMPNTADNQMKDYYPGDIYVDWLGVSCYPPSLSETFPEEKRYPLTLMKDIHTISPDKPIMISEGGYSGGCDRKRWIREWFEIKTAYPRVKAVIWENHENTNTENSDRRLQSDPEALELYKQLVQDPYWLDAIPTEVYQEFESRK